MGSAGWPVVLSDGPVSLRPLSLRDAAAWVRARRHNIEWLRPWEASPPQWPGSRTGSVPPVPSSTATYVAMTRRLRREARRGRGLPFTIWYDGELVGQLNVSGITRGSLQSASLGYWIDGRVAGRGIMPTAVALVTDHCFFELGLHRIEVNIRPENTASRRVVEKLAFREEGVRVRFLHIAGDWRDHIAYAVTREEVPGGLLARWHRTHPAPDAHPSASDPHQSPSQTSS
ncbi:MAG TPA: GNAT family protein [Mycobacteriales bacterium]|nr:GNAT family protein [Mycobacteriales bacterium]